MTMATAPSPTPPPAKGLEPFTPRPGRPGVPPIVEFRHVTKTYAAGTPRAFTAVRDVTFCVEDLEGVGEFIAILGPSGCGKSTILRLIAGLAPQFPQTSGEVRVHGRALNGPGADRGMVFQDYTSFDNRTVVDNVAFGLECRGVGRQARRAEALEWIARVGLDVRKDAHKYPHQPSPEPSSSNRESSSWTSRSGPSTPSPATTCRTCSSRSGAKSRPRCSSSPMT